MSAESGIATFREALTGLWSRFDADRLATPEAFEADPATVWGWYLWRAALIRGATPHAGHRALAAWAARVRLDIVTQNVDDLHERAGSAVLTHLHGNLLAWRCHDCGTPFSGDLALPEEPVVVPPPRCTACGGPIRPGVVWFGEALPDGAFELALDACRASDLVLSVGTSGLVYPAAALPDLALARGIPVVELNPQATGHTRDVTTAWRVTAAEGLPALVEALAEA
jgi:NAD-dependent deacetylase